MRAGAHLLLSHPFLFPPVFSPPVPSPFFSLSSRAPLSQLRGLGERCKLSQWGPGPRLKTNLVHSKAVTKPLVAIILSILECMLFYSRTIKI